MNSTIYKYFAVAVCMSLLLVNQSPSALAQSLTDSVSTGPPNAQSALPDASGVKSAPHEFELGQIHGLCWEKAGESKAIVVCLHGFTLSANSYSSFGSALSDHGLVVYAPELSGITHRDDIYEFNQKLNLDKTVRDVQWLAGELKRRYPYKPIFLLGESLGGAVAIRSADYSQENLSGLICIAPSWKYNKERSLVVKGAIAALTGRNVVRSLTSTVIPMVTSDRQLQERLRNDAFLKKSYSLAETLRALRFLEKTGNAAKRVDVPALVLQGLNDHMGSAEGTAVLVRTMPSRRKEFVLLGGMEHLIAEDVNVDDRVCSLIEDWIKEAEAGVASSAITTTAFIGNRPVPPIAERLFKIAGGNKLSELSAKRIDDLETRLTGPR